MCNGVMKFEGSNSEFLAQNTSRIKPMLKKWMAYVYTVIWEQ